MTLSISIIYINAFYRKLQTYNLYDKSCQRSVSNCRHQTPLQNETIVVICKLNGQTQGVIKGERGGTAYHLLQQILAIARKTLIQCIMHKFFNVLIILIFKVCHATTYHWVQLRIQQLQLSQYENIFITLITW